MNARLHAVVMLDVTGDVGGVGGQPLSLLSPAHFSCPWEDSIGWAVSSDSVQSSHLHI